ncbi:MAG: SpoIIE family protein phosphatase [Gemmataceae bacterium]|nr:SpoIIE family protein phosphatase [Gemmataceae bacterium]
MAEQPRVVIVSDRPDPRWSAAGWPVVGSEQSIPPTDILVCDGPPIPNQAPIVALTEEYARASAVEINRELQQAYSRINGDLEIARRLQESFLPSRLPEVGRVRFAAARKVHEFVSGDCYDVFRLDERHIGFYLADAMGHGVSAALLSVYLKRAVSGKEILPGGYRLIPPNEVLARLNQDLLALQLAEEPFVTMCYGVVDTESGRLRLARAAHPAPFLVKGSGEISQLSEPGPPLGVFAADYVDCDRVLTSGDRVVLLTDGYFPDPTQINAHQKALAETSKSSLDLAVQELAARLPNASDDATILTLELLAVD